MITDLSDEAPESGAQEPARVHSPRLWRDQGWTARVIKSEDDDGWAVEMHLDGQSEPALVAPWTMGRDKKNPKPLDSAAFSTWVKTAHEVVRRHEQQLHALLHKRVVVDVDGCHVGVTLDITPDDDTPFGTLSAYDAHAAMLAQVTVAVHFKLTEHSATQWVLAGYANPLRLHD